MTDGLAPAAPSGGALEAATELAASLAAASAGTVRGILLYGSHLHGARPDAHSALDFVVVVSGYRPFYEAMHRAGEIHRPVWMMSWLAGVLPPNVIAFAPDDGAAGIAKCLVVSGEDLETALGPAPRDHFLLGRLVQRIAVIWAANDGDAAWLEARLADARGGVLDWVGPYLAEPFDAESLGRRLLEVCYKGEVRPEARDRSAKIFETQREHFARTLAPVLERAERTGRCVVGPDGYRFVTAPTPAEGRRWRRHFTRSKVRATLRWFKHMFTFDNWLPYVQRKVERRLGKPVRLTRLERRWPLIFLWPRALRVLLTRPDREGKA